MNKIKNVRVPTLVKLSILTLVISLAFINGTNAFYISKTDISTNKVTLGCWIAPETPELIYPENEATINDKTEWKENPYFDWVGSASPCPVDDSVYYYYEAYTDENLEDEAYKSGKLNKSKIKAPGIPDDTYWWRVKSCDAFDNCSKWSDPWKFTLDIKESEGSEDNVSDVNSETELLQVAEENPEADAQIDNSQNSSENDNSGEESGEESANTNEESNTAEE